MKNPNKPFVIFTSVLIGAIVISTYAVVSKDGIKTTETSISSQSVQTDDYKVYKAEQEKKIAENDRKIAELKAKKSLTDYENKITEYEKKNNELRKKINAAYKDVGKEKWASFKKEFNHDMDELGRSLKDLFTDNVVE